MRSEWAEYERLENAVAEHLAVAQVADPVNLPDHYTKLPVECIDVTEHFNFCLGNAIKYIWRADHKGNPVQDLEKAIWYLRRELDRRERDGR